VTRTSPANTAFGGTQCLGENSSREWIALFVGLAASGWHTAAITMRLQVEGGLPIAGGVVSAGGEMSWPRPTRPGDIESEVVDV